ncbi:hypothetical protein G6F35_004978 [Rhizopus arrhizus]|nr:hypothetical protein G6F23_006251 [Rhizopus arrhizus]KAG0948448.1 hypothetical protein G6F32_005831 [Rhizopus arrhizus]KAG1222931.1 hypothetical protein G6F35_004978 [Rhizopus arrhizus]KAG1297947.1 hypothetical protein G6F66_002164 [Rhizopus arrhizus]
MMRKKWEYNITAAAMELDEDAMMELKEEHEDDEASNISDEEENEADVQSNDASNARRVYTQQDINKLIALLVEQCHTVDCTEFWKKRKREFSLTTASANCSEIMNQMLLSDSQSLVEPLNQTQTTESLTQNPEQATATLRPINDNSSETCLNQGHSNIRQESGSEEQINWFIDNDDITSLFRKYQYQADAISKPAPLESNIQEIFVRSIFKEKQLDNILKNQIQVLLNNVPSNTPNFNNDDLMKMVNVVTDMDYQTITPKAAKLSLLTFAAGLDPFKAKVVEGVADMLVKLPMTSTADKNSLGEVDLQTRCFDPLLLSMISDTTKKVVLCWSNKVDTLTPDIRPDAIVSTLVQRVFGQSLGFGEIKLGGDQVTNHPLCLDTLKLAVLSRNTILKHNIPVLSF